MRNLSSRIDVVGIALSIPVIILGFILASCGSNHEQKHEPMSETSKSSSYQMLVIEKCFEVRKIEIDGVAYIITETCNGLTMVRHEVDSTSNE